MNRVKIASELVKIAKELTANRDLDFLSKELQHIHSRLDYMADHLTIYKEKDMNKETKRVHLLKAIREAIKDSSKFRDSLNTVIDIGSGYYDEQ